MAWVEPLSLETWVLNIFSGSTSIFTAVAILFISGLAGYFRMTMATMFFMLGLFFFMFAGFVEPSFAILISIFGGLIVGYMLSRFAER